MRILIIEDEEQAAWNLQQSIRAVEPAAEILGPVDTLAAVKDWFARNEMPDLVFSDIQLGDGIVFDAFRQLTLRCPVIFCTAYDEYLLQAFKGNGIDYLLKPIDEAELRQSFEKLAILRQSLGRKDIPDLLQEAVSEWIERKKSFKKNFLIPHRDKLIPIETAQIAYFKVNETEAEIALMDGKTYHHHFTLDYLASVLDPQQFYRVNRQFLIAYEAIQEIEHYEDRKLLLLLKSSRAERILVSKAKGPAFLKWVQSR